MSAVKPSYCPSSTGFGLFAPTIDPKRSFALYNDLSSVFSTPKSKPTRDQFSFSLTKSPSCSFLGTARGVDSDSDSDNESESDDDYDLVSTPPPYSEFGVIRRDAHDAPYHPPTLNSAPSSQTLWARIGSFALSMKLMRGTRS